MCVTQLCSGVQSQDLGSLNAFVCGSVFSGQAFAISVEGSICLTLCLHTDSHASGNRQETSQRYLYMAYLANHNKQ